MSNSKLSYLLIACLGFSSGLPAALFASTLQAWFVQSGHSVLFVSNLGLIVAMIFFRVFFAPLADNYFITSLGRRKTWIIATQILLLLSIEAMACFDPAVSPWSVLALGIFLAFVSSLQDMVIDAHRIEYLEPESFGYGAVVAIYAGRMALILSGGGSLLFASRYGFPLTYALIGGLFLFTAGFVFYSKEPKIHKVEQKEGPYRDFLQQPKLLTIMGLIFFIKFGEVFVANTSPMMIPFMLQGLGLGLVKVAYLNKIFGMGAQVVGGLIGAYFIRRFSLMNLMLGFGLAEVVANVLFVFLSLYPVYNTLLWSAVTLENFASGFTSIIVVVFLMRLVNPCFSATHYSLWIMVAIFPRVLAGPLGGYVSTHYGWPNLFILSSSLTSLFLIFWWRLRSIDLLNHPRKIVTEMVESS